MAIMTSRRVLRTRASKAPPKHGVAVHLLLGLSLLCATTAAAAAGCSSCPLTYDPVVDDDTGIPFYNDCLASCQLGASANLKRADALQAEADDDAARVASSDGSAGAPSTAARKRRALDLLSPPSKKAFVKGERVGKKTISAFSDEGFFFVGKPGFSDDAQSQGLPGLGPASTAADTTADTNARSRSKQQAAGTAPQDTPELTFFMRMTADGNLYMKALKKDAMKKLEQLHTAPNAKSRALARPSPPDESDPAFGATPIEANSTFGVMGVGGRRLLQPAIIGCSAHQLNGVWRCISGADDRREITFKAAFPFSAVARVQVNSQGGACSGALLGGTGRFVITAAHCLYNTATKTWSHTGFVQPGYYRGTAPYGTAYVQYSEVKTAWTNNGDYNWDMGLIRLTSRASGGGLGYAYNCGSRAYGLATAGYPVDKPARTFWWQGVGTGNLDVCTGSPQKVMYYDSAQGQSGSVFFDGSNHVRFVLSYYNNGLAITPNNFAWMQEFASRIA